MYRVSHLLANLGWVALDLGCSAILLQQKGATEAAKRLGELPNSQSTQPMFARRWDTLYVYVTLLPSNSLALAAMRIFLSSRMRRSCSARLGISPARMLRSCSRRACHLQEKFIYSKFHYFLTLSEPSNINV